MGSGVRRAERVGDGGGVRLGNPTWGRRKRSLPGGWLQLEFLSGVFDLFGEFTLSYRGLYL